MKKIAILTLGDNAPGMNTCIRSIELTAKNYELEVFGYKQDYKGLIE